MKNRQDTDIYAQTCIYTIFFCDGVKNLNSNE